MAKAAPIHFEEGMTFGQAAAATIAVRIHELFACAPHVLDTADIERVHDMRVASRRLRAALEVFAPCFEPKEHRRVLGEVEQLADALGARRDPDVQIAALQELRGQLQSDEQPGVDLLIERARERQVAGNADLEEALESALTHDLWARLEGLARP
jgi:CHAD domain-containing protein